MAAVVATRRPVAMGWGRRRAAAGRREPATAWNALRNHGLLGEEDTAGMRNDVGAMGAPL
jgi:hypothetical protein